MTTKLRAVRTRLPAAIEALNRGNALAILSDSQPLVPVDTGALKRSGRVEPAQAGETVIKSRTRRSSDPRGITSQKGGSVIVYGGGPIDYAGVRPLSSRCETSGRPGAVRRPTPPNRTRDTGAVTATYQGVHAEVAQRILNVISLANASTSVNCASSEFLDDGAIRQSDLRNFQTTEFREDGEGESQRTPWQSIRSAERRSMAALSEDRSGSGVAGRTAGGASRSRVDQARPGALLRSPTPLTTSTSTSSSNSRMSNTKLEREMDRTHERRDRRTRCASTGSLVKSTT